MTSVCVLKCKEYNSEGTEVVIRDTREEQPISVYCPHATECDKTIRRGILDGGGIDGKRCPYGAVSLKWAKK